MYLIRVVSKVTSAAAVTMNVNRCSRMHSKEIAENARVASLLASHKYDVYGRGSGAGSQPLRGLTKAASVCPSQ